MVFCRIFGGQNGFDPDPATFPDINIDRLGSGLKLEKRGKADGASGLPSEDAEPYTSAEYEAIERVRQIRRKALDNYELHINTYEERIRGARGEREQIELHAGELQNSMKVTCDIWSNQLTNERLGVYEYKEKLEAYRHRHGIKGPPRKKKNFMLMIGTVLFILVIEVLLSGTLFSQKNEMGVIGGMGVALVISSVNVLSCLLCGFGSRYFNLRSAGAKLFGAALAVIFVAIALGLNITVAHFRDALETASWEAAAFDAIAGLQADPLGIQSFNSWIVFAFGLIVSVVAYLEGLLWLDAHPGHNRIYDDARKAVDDYSDHYDEAQGALEELFSRSRNGLRIEAQRLRSRIRSAIDAVSGRAAITRQLDAFLESCDSAANQLLTRYREANRKARQDAWPKYFDQPYRFEQYSYASDDKSDVIGIARDEIDKIDTIVEQGVSHILKTRENAISAFPTVDKLLEEMGSRASSTRMQERLPELRGAHHGSKETR